MAEKQACRKRGRELIWDPQKRESIATELPVPVKERYCTPRCEFKGRQVVESAQALLRERVGALTLPEGRRKFSLSRIDRDLGIRNRMVRELGSELGDEIRRAGLEELP